MAKCRGCGASIVWIKTAKGKMMPCNPQMVGFITKTGASGKIVTSDGEVLSAEVTDDLGSSTGVGYIPHWATCPAAWKFRW